MLDQQPKYDDYRNSGEVWLGDIPSDWNLECIRAVTELKSKRGEPDLPVLSVYRDYGVILKDSRDDNHNATSLDTSNYKVVAPGDLVVNKMKAWQGSMGVSAYEGIVSPAYITCRTDPSKIVPGFLHYTLRSQPFIAVYNSLSYGVRIGQWDMHYDDFKKIPLAYPDIDTQNRIVSFLDEKTAEIDAAIEKKRRLIDLLNEQKAILINRAVTKGLNPDAPMKISGVDWIGEIPAHWDCAPLKWHLRVSSGEFLDGSKMVAEFDEAKPVPVVGGNGIMGYTSAPSTTEQETLVIGRVGALCGNVHLFTRPIWVTDNAILVAYSQCLFGAYLASTLDALDLNRLANKNAQPLITGTMIKAQSIPIPPFDEQSKINGFIAQTSADIALAIASERKTITTLNEFKQTLIANSVTGKIKI
ncbi:restriction endonuclease subunit S [Ascidiaceihabitans sp.]|uniref:restriction endonuclease subunit S n=1 Tax=Ascidiaceihabitans sp. TaxID=1872644 RepID=UPI0032980755